MKNLSFEKLFAGDLLSKRERVELTLNHLAVDRVAILEQLSYNPGVMAMYTGKEIRGFNYSIDDICRVIRQTTDMIMPPVSPKGTERVTNSDGFVYQNDNWTSWHVSWPFLPGKLRFFVESLQPGERKQFELVQNDDIAAPVRESRFFKPFFDEQSGNISNLLFIPLNKMVFSDQSDYLPGQLIAERPKGEFPRSLMADKKLASVDLQYKVPEITEHALMNSAIVQRYQTVQKEPFAKQIEQHWDFFDTIPRVEITTTIWINENPDPLAIYMAFPFDVQNPRIYYDSLGTRVEVGENQMPNTCGECNTVQDGISIIGKEINIALSTLDAPLGLFDSIVRGKGRITFKPRTAHFYSLLCQNYWITNFAALSPAKLTFRYIIDFSEPGSTLEPIENDELWAFPGINQQS